MAKIKKIITGIVEKVSEKKGKKKMQDYAAGKISAQAVIKKPTIKKPPKKK